MSKKLLVPSFRERQPFRYDNYLFTRFYINFKKHLIAQ